MAARGSIAEVRGLMKLGRHGAKLRILDALASNGGIRHDAARELGIRRQAFARMIGQLDMWSAVDLLDDQLGRRSGMKHTRARRRRDTEERKPSHVGALAVARPRIAAMEILDAVTKADGKLAKAARSLGTTVATLERHVSRLGLWGRLNEYARRFGWREYQKAKAILRSAPGRRRAKMIS